MRIIEIRENNDIVLPDEWKNQEVPANAIALKRKIKSLDHQAELIMFKLQRWAEVAKGKVFTTTGQKTGMRLPTQVEKNPRKYLSWTLIHDSSIGLVTKVYVDSEDRNVVRPIRKLVDRHNTLTNQIAEMQGVLNKHRTSSTGAR